MNAFPVLILGIVLYAIAEGLSLEFSELLEFLFKFIFVIVKAIGIAAIVYGGASLALLGT